MLVTAFKILLLWLDLNQFSICWYAWEHTMCWAGAHPDPRAWVMPWQPLEPSLPWINNRAMFLSHISKHIRHYHKRKIGSIIHPIIYDCHRLPTQAYFFFLLFLNKKELLHYAKRESKVVFLRYEGGITWALYKSYINLFSCCMRISVWMVMCLWGLM